MKEHIALMKKSYKTKNNKKKTTKRNNNKKPKPESDQHPTYKKYKGIK